MGRERRHLPAAVTNGPKERHRRAQRLHGDLRPPQTRALVAKPAIPKSKHHSYFEFVENTEKKKRLDFQIVHKKEPPPGFEYVPVGNPRLTTACKELSREKDAMIFIVSDATSITSHDLSKQMHRIGHHFRQTIVEEARKNISGSSDQAATGSDGEPEPIPRNQAEYNAQVDAVMRDLFPRIPNTDRQSILDHSFSLRMDARAKQRVGLQAHLSLARRVQLAVLAHIRHTHTRYDHLLKETSWAQARKVVESLCLDVLVKWRGDEETGRDQLDEILREVVVISDSESEGSDDGDTDASSVGEPDDVAILSVLPLQPPRVVGAPCPPPAPGVPGIAGHRPHLAPIGSNAGRLTQRRDRAADKRDQRGFKRYRAWQDAIDRNRANETSGPGPVPEASGLNADPVTASSGEHMHHGSVGAWQQIHSTNHAGTDPRLWSHPNSVSHSAAGGTWPQAPVYSGPLAPSRFHAYGASKFADVNPPEQVTALAQAQESHGSFMRRPQPPSASRLQDFLVPSIEPASPNAVGPSFVRALPPRPADLVERHSRSDVQPPPWSNAHSRDAHGETAVTRRLAYEPAAHQGGFVQDPALMHHMNAPEPQYLAAQKRRDPNVDSFQARTMTSTHEVQYSSGLPVAGRVLVDAPRPGERSNPILMEDRGGFYERVPVSSGVGAANAHALPVNAGHLASQPRPVEYREEPLVPHQHRENGYLQGAPTSGRYEPVQDRGRGVSVGSFPMRRDVQYSSAPGYRFHAETQPVRTQATEYDYRPAPEAEPPTTYSQWQASQAHRSRFEPYQRAGPVHRMYGEQRWRHADEDARRNTPLQRGSSSNVIILD